MGDDNKFDGVINIHTDPERNVNYIESLPPNERLIALKYENKLFPFEFKKLLNSFENFYKAVIGITNPSWPASKEGIANWKACNRRMKVLDKIYSEQLHIRKPTNKEYAEDLASHHVFGYNGKPYDERTIRSIKKAAKNGYLD